MNAQEIMAILHKACEEAGSQAAWAKAHGISPSHVSDVLRGRRELAGKLLDILGFDRIVCYKKKAASRL